MKRMLVVLGLTAALAAPVQAQDGYVEQAGWGALAALANVAYMPAKLVYAAVGAMIGGTSYIVAGADLHAASAVWGPALGGTYVLTPQMLRGEREVHFAGRARCAGTRSVAVEAPGRVADEPLPPVAPKSVKP